MPDYTTAFQGAPVVKIINTVSKIADIKPELIFSLEVLYGEQLFHAAGKFISDPNLCYAVLCGDEVEINDPERVGFG